MLNREKLDEFARGAGADILGIANIERFDELPAEKHPKTIFPEVKSVIVLGRRITRGTLRGVEEGTQFYHYSLFGNEWIDNRFTSLMTFQVSEFIEDNGWEAVPLPNLPPEVPPLGFAVKPGQVEPNVMLDFDDAAVRAGVGEIGYCNVLLTPEFGPRQRIQMILTDAEIEPTPLLEKEICPRSPEFKEFCPLGAFVGEKELVVCGKKMKVAEIDFSKCNQCENGALPNRYHPAGRPDRIAALCIRTYMDYLEKNDRLSKRFLSPFRKRESWQRIKKTNLYKV
jgi:epoxyqueuosine reductase QueG